MSAKPRYQQLADELRAGIASGEVPADRFPTESVLCARYGVSRFTVREALRALQAEGLISRRRGSGTTLSRPPTLHQPLSNVAEILQYAADTRIDFAVHPPAPLPRWLADELRVTPTDLWARFDGVRRRGVDDVAIAVTQAWVVEAYAHLAPRIALSDGPIFRQIEALAMIRIARVTQDIQAVAATADVAAALDVAKRAPCLRILRCYLDAAGGIVEVSVSHHPGDRFAYAMHTEVGA